MKAEISEERGGQFLDKVYEFALNGIPRVDIPIDKLVNEYSQRYQSKDQAIKKFVNTQKIKCTTTGFVTGLGGLLTLPVTIPADLASSIYIELRMIAAIASFRGYNIYDDEVKALIYICLVGNAAGDVIKQVGIKGMNQLVANKLLPKISREMLTKINQKVGFRLLTRGGSKGLINLGKAVPIVGGFVGGAFNLAEVTIFANRAKQFFEK